MNPDILAALVAFLQAAMRASLASSTGYPQVYAEYAPQSNPDGSTVSQPYAVVTDGDETYSAQSEDPASGFAISVLADGTLDVGFYATTKTQAKALGRAAVRQVSDTQVALVAADGRVVTVLPRRGRSVPLYTEGIAQPTSYLRVITFEYVQQFPE